MKAYSSDREIEALEDEIFNSLNDDYCWERHCAYYDDYDPMDDLLPTREHLDSLAEQAFGSFRLKMRYAARMIDRAHEDPDHMPPDWDAFD